MQCGIWEFAFRASNARNRVSFVHISSKCVLPHFAFCRRKRACLANFNMSEQCLCLDSHPQKPLIAFGTSGGLVKLFSLRSELYPAILRHSPEKLQAGPVHAVSCSPCGAFLASSGCTQLSAPPAADSESSSEPGADGDAKLRQFTFSIRVWLLSSSAGGDNENEDVSVQLLCDDITVSQTFSQSLSALAADMPFAFLHQGAVRALAFHPTFAAGRERCSLLVSASDDYSVRFWRFTARNNAGRVCRQHKAPVSSICFHDDGRFMASASTDGAVSVWKLARRGTTEDGKDAQVAVVQICTYNISVRALSVAS